MNKKMIKKETNTQKKNIKTRNKMQDVKLKNKQATKKKKRKTKKKKKKKKMKNNKKATTRTHTHTHPLGKLGTQPTHLYKVSFGGQCRHWYHRDNSPRTKHTDT